MRIRKTLFAALGAALIAASPTLVPATPAAAQQAQDRDQQRAYDRAKSGEMLSLSTIKQCVGPRMRGYRFVDADLRGDTYRLKYVRGDRLVWVDVDARRCRIVGSSN